MAVSPKSPSLGPPQRPGGHVGEQVVLDLVVQPAERDVDQRAAAHVAGRQHLAAQKVPVVVPAQDRRALVVGG